MMNAFAWHWPWVLAIGLIAALAAAAVSFFLSGRARRGSAQAPVFDLEQDFNTEYTSGMLRQWRWYNRVAAVALAAALILSVSLAARPSQVGSDEERAGSRDIVLCLDVSPSMLAYDHAVLETYQRLVAQFKGERIGLSIFNSTSRTLFPLTDDYDMASSQIRYASDVLGKVSDQDKIDKMDAKTSQDFSDLIEGTQNRKDMTSLIGDGLVSCAAMLPGFTYGSNGRGSSESGGPTEQRPKSIVLATDNVSGKSTYTLKEALDLTSKAKIGVDGLYSGAQTSKNDKTTLDMKRQIESHGGTFSGDGTGPQAIDAIVESIEKHKARSQDQARKASMLDTPGWWTLALALAVCIWISMTWKLKR